MSKYISELSPAQQQAVTFYNGATLVIAGAGSGKTRVLTYRIAYMIEQGVAPNSILSLTFTNKAAEEMRKRITTVVGAKLSREILMGTFHSVFSKILRCDSAALGFTDSFTIYEPSDCKNLIKTIVKDMGLDEGKYIPKMIYNKISLLKNNLTTPQIYASNDIFLSEDRKRGLSEFANIYKSYMVRCKKNNAMDFDDLLLYTNILLRDRPDILKKYQQKFKYILVDEYQDTNSAQYLIVRKLAETHGNLCVVGDDAQSIYSFRGAKIENILRFNKDYPKASIVKLEENYRSTQTIVSAANCVIAKNSNQIKKNVFSTKEHGENISLIRAFTDKEESIAIRKSIEQEIDKGIQYGDIAVLYRTNAQSRSIEEQLRIRQIPYKIHKGTAFYQRAEIKNILAYVRLITNQHDDEAFKRVINFPARGIGNTSLEKISLYAKENTLSLWDATSLNNPDQMGIRGVASKNITNFISLIEKYRELAKDNDAYNIVYELIGESGILSQYRENQDPEAQTAYENIEELVNSLKSQCEMTLKEEDQTLTIKTWIENVALLTDTEAQSDQGDNKVTLMTIHSAKGLEYNTLYIAGVEEGMFPSTGANENNNELEEERRLFYVAITRAIRKLTISYALSRYKWGSSTNTIPSRFIAEIDAKYYDCPELMTAKGAYEQTEDTQPIQRNFYQSKPTIQRGLVGQKADTTQFKSMPQYQKGESIACSGDISIGDKVEHDRFGRGEVLSMEKTSLDTKITVKFDVSGEKNLLMKFAKLKKI